MKKIYIAHVGAHDLGASVARILADRHIDDAEIINAEFHKEMKQLPDNLKLTKAALEMPFVQRPNRAERRRQAKNRR